MLRAGKTKEVNEPHPAPGLLINEPMTLLWLRFLIRERWYHPYRAIVRFL